MQFRLTDWQISSISIWINKSEMTAFMTVISLFLFFSCCQIWFENDTGQQ